MEENVRNSYWLLESISGQVVHMSLLHQHAVQTYWAAPQIYRWALLTYLRTRFHSELRSLPLFSQWWVKKSISSLLVGYSNRPSLIFDLFSLQPGTVELDFQPLPCSNVLCIGQLHGSRVFSKQITGNNCLKTRIQHILNISLHH